MMRLRIIGLFLLFLLGAAASVAAQQLYRWTDERGRVHVTDTPPPSSATSVQKKTYRGGGSAGAPTSYELSLAMKEYPVTLYTAPICKEPCQDARAALNRRGVPFKEIQVHDEATTEELKRVSGSNEVPTLLVGRSVHKGFDQAAFDALLDSARYPRTGILPARAQAAPALPEAEPAAPAAPAAEEPKPTGPYAPK